MYTPTDKKLQEIKERVSPESWQQRVAKARQLQMLVEEVEDHIRAGLLQEDAIREACEPSQRSRMLRALKRYRRDGFEGLIDRRRPRERQVSREERVVIEGMRRANPEMGAEQIEEQVIKTLGRSPSQATIKRVLKEAGLERPVGRPKDQTPEGVEVEPLGAAGLELLKAAEAETGAVDALVDGVMEVAESLPEPRGAEPEDYEDRNDKGQLLGDYNRKRRKRAGEKVSQAYRTTGEKASERDLGRLSFREQSRDTIEAKMWALMAMPALTKSNRINELYGPMGRHLEGICGRDYMPETLRKTATEWSLASAGYVLQEIHAQTWHEVSQEKWERGYQASVVYIDNTAKPLWTNKFVKAAKVATTGRVQPALVSTYIHSGAGVPIYFETHSGQAPLAGRALKLLEKVERRTGRPVGRLTVIDGEGCSAALLKEFKSQNRDLVTPLPSSIAKPERILFGKGSAPQPYRDGDTIREGKVKLNDSKGRGEELWVRAIVIEQRTKGAWMVLVTLADRDEWPARRLANIYYGRWPKQEAFFRRGNGAVALQKVNGYGKREVANTTVVTKLDKLERQIERKGQKLQEAGSELAELDAEIKEVEKSKRSKERYVAKRKERVDEGLEQGSTRTVKFEQAVQELRDSTGTLEDIEDTMKRLQAKRKKTKQQKSKAERQIEKWHQEKEKLEPRATILEADTDKDILFTTLKITLAMLMHYVVVEYFRRRRMEWTTFLSRLALLSGRRERTETTETVYIQANERDKELMEALEAACQEITKRRITYKGRLLRYVLEWPNGATAGAS
jgi:hypothetical protein